MQQFFLKGVFKVLSQLESLNTTVSSSGRQRTNNRSQLSPSLPHGSLLPRKKKGQDGPSPNSPFLPQPLRAEGKGTLQHSLTHQLSPSSSPQPRLALTPRLCLPNQGWLLQGSPGSTAQAAAEMSPHTQGCLHQHSSGGHWWL